jgi:hypothetical protein
MGGSYTKFKVKQSGNYYSGYYSDTKDVNFYTANLELTPIRYNVGKIDFAGAIQFGGARSEDYSNSDTFFYGASVTASLNKQVGISLDTKVSDNFNSMNTISMVGYY